MEGEWPLVGREGPLGQVRTVLTGDANRSVVLAGAAGVGKTRLAREALQLADRHGLATARVTATQATATVPFGALAPLLPVTQPGEGGGVDDRAELLRRSAASLAERARNGRLVLLTDDAHLLDPASATVIHQLAETSAASVLATIRTGEAVPDPVLALWKDGLAERVDVPGLTAQAVHELLSKVLGGPVDSAAAVEFSVRCQGNVLFLRELVRSALRDGALRDEGGIWRLAGGFSPSGRLIELVEARLGRLGAEERSVLELVSLAEPVGAAELSSLGDPNVAEDLERRGLLASRMDGQRLEIRLAHPLYGEVLRTRTPALRARSLARSLAEVVEATGARRREDILRVATWRLDGGGGGPDLMLAAATLTRWRYDFPLAERLARAAVTAGAGFPARLLAAQLASLQGRGEEAEQELAVLAGEASDDAQRAAVALIRVDNRAFYLGRPDEGLMIAEEAERLITDKDARDDLRARRAALAFAQHGPSAGAELAVPLLDRPGGRALVWASQVASFTLGRLGRIDAALDAAEQGHAAHLALAHPLDWYPWVHVFFRCQVLAWGGRLDEAEQLACAQYEQALAEHSDEGRAWFAWHLVSVVGERGHVHAAIRYGREAVALFQKLGRPQFMSFCLPYLATALALGGHAEEAVAALQQLDDLGVRHLFMGVDPLQSRAWVAAATGDLRGATEILEQAAAQGAEIGDLTGRAAALHAVARLGRAKDVVDRLTEQAEALQCDLANARASHVQALVGGRADDLLGVSETFEAMGADLLAAEAAADAAVAWRRSGEPRRATGAERRAVDLVDRCEGPTTPALQAVETRSRLAPAEREAALLASTGLSNKEIAEQLYISVRTVEGRLQRAYEKLGVSSRAELAAALHMVHGR